MKVVTNEEAWLLHSDISSRLRVIGVWKVENPTHMHTYIRSLAKNYIFRPFLLSEYSDTNISNFFSRNHNSLNEKAKCMLHTSKLTCICIFQKNHISEGKCKLPLNAFHDIYVKICYCFEQNSLKITYYWRIQYLHPISLLNSPPPSQPRFAFYKILPNEKKFEQNSAEKTC